jgi:3-methyladenine DNA glycosylase AlkD
MTLVRTVRALEETLRSLGTAARAEQEKRYLKSSMVHLGCDAKAVRTSTKAMLRELDPDRETLLALCEKLWAPGIWELRAAAMNAMIEREKLFELRDFGWLEHHIRESKTWALVDAIAVNAVGPLVEREPKSGKILDRWIKDDDFWVQRSAMLALLIPLRRGEGDFERFARYADGLLEEKEFFIRKAIGWILRESGKKRPERVKEFLTPRIARASGVTVREAVKPLTARDRAALLAAYKAK